jgi:hypothetical protein
MNESSSVIKPRFPAQVPLLKGESPPIFGGIFLAAGSSLFLSAFIFLRATVLSPLAFGLQPTTTH